MILSFIVFSTKDQLKDEKKRSELMGRPLQLGNAFVGKIFFPKALYERNTKVFGTEVFLEKEYLAELAIRDPLKIFLFVVSEEQYKVLSDPENTGLLFMLKSKAGMPKENNFYFERLQVSQMFLEKDKASTILHIEMDF
jgi:hypothetical protein